jgi:hypothetical protein
MLSRIKVFRTQSWTTKLSPIMMHLGLLLVVRIYSRTLIPLSPPLSGYSSTVPISSFNTLDAESIAFFSGYASNNSISNGFHAVDVETQGSAAFEHVPLGMQALPQAPASSIGALIATIPAFQCHSCPQSFRRSSDLTRHHSSIHHAVPGLFLCPVQGCVKSQGAGYRRRDKLTEHLWKKHGNLGFAKRV